jgi:hypothetical protein
MAEGGVGHDVDDNKDTYQYFLRLTPKLKILNLNKLRRCFGAGQEKGGIKK